MFRSVFKVVKDWRGSSAHTSTSALAPSVTPSAPSQERAAHAAESSAAAAGSPAAFKDFVHNPSVRYDRSRICAGKDSHTCFECLQDALVSPLPERTHMGGVHRKLPICPRGDIGKSGDVYQRGNQGNSLLH